MARTSPARNGSACHCGTLLPLIFGDISAPVMAMTQSLTARSLGPTSRISRPAAPGSSRRMSGPPGPLPTRRLAIRRASEFCAPEGGIPSDWPCWRPMSCTVVIEPGSMISNMSLRLCARQADRACRLKLPQPVLISGDVEHVVLDRVVVRSVFNGGSDLVIFFLRYRHVAMPVARLRENRSVGEGSVLLLRLENIDRGTTEELAATRRPERIDGRGIATEIKQSRMGPCSRCSVQRCAEFLARIHRVGHESTGNETDARHPVVRTGMEGQRLRRP